MRLARMVHNSLTQRLLVKAVSLDSGHQLVRSRDAGKNLSSA